MIKDFSATIHIIGLGVSEKAELLEPAREALKQSSWVVGSERQLKVVAHLLDEDQKQKILPPLKALSQWLREEKLSESSFSILASGDPLYFGIGRWFLKHYPIDVLNFYPAVSSIQAACHEIGVALQDVEVLSLHGRPLAQIRKTLKPAQTLIVLSDKKSNPQVLAKECINAGFLDASITVCENLGYPEQGVNTFKVKDLSGSSENFDPLHLSVIKTGLSVSNLLPSFPGIPDENFVTKIGSDKGKAYKAMMTKREVRLAILSLMQANNADVIWDIGAGCGSVSVELAYWNKTVQVHAVEHHPERLACLNENSDRFGVGSQLNIVEGSAPDCLVDLPDPSKVFIGGSDGRMPELLACSWNKLPENGLLVIAAVTETSKSHVLKFHDSIESTCELETLQISVSKGSQLAKQLIYRPNLPVTLFCLKKKSVAKI